MLLILHILPRTFMSTFYHHDVVYYHIRDEENLELHECDMRFSCTYEVNLTPGWQAFCQAHNLVPGVMVKLPTDHDGGAELLARVIED